MLQFRQKLVELAALVLEYVPGLHAVQSLELEEPANKRYLPVPQGMHKEPSMLLYFPDSHVEQKDEPRPEDFPCSHAVQFTELEFGV